MPIHKETTIKTPPELSRKQNRILAALPDVSLNLKLVDLPLGKTLYSPGEKIDIVYFPVTGCIVSLIYVMENGNSAEIAVIGNDGLVGVPLLMGSLSMLNVAVVQSAGSAYTLKKQDFLDAIKTHRDLKKLLLMYTQALITQMSMTAVCNRHHSIEKQFCRCLLLSMDRINGNELRMTHNLISDMLGVRREGVTKAATIMKNLGFIDYHRGNIIVINRDGLESKVCECYQVVKKEYDRLLPGVTT